MRAGARTGIDTRIAFVILRVPEWDPRNRVALDFACWKRYTTSRGLLGQSQLKEVSAVATLTMEIPEKVLAALRNNPEQFAGEMRLAAAALWYEQGRVSQEIAAKIAGLSRTDFLLALARIGKDSFRVDFGDLDKELARG